MPEGYLGPGATATLEEFALRASAAGADPRKLWARFPSDEVASSIVNTWAGASATLYANWLRLARAAVPARA